MESLEWIIQFYQWIKTEKQASVTVDATCLKISLFLTERKS